MTRASKRRKRASPTPRLDELDSVRVGIYLRRSTDDEHQPYSIDAQNDRLLSYIDSQPGWHLTMRFSDDASGASTEREGLQNALRAARAGLFDVLLVYRVDRFSRNLRDMVTLLDDLDQHQVVFRSATEPFDTSTPMGRMLVQMLGMFAQFERDTIIDRVIAGMERKAAKGLWKGGRRPYGYNVDSAAHKLVPHPSEAAVIRTLFRLYTMDRLGTRAVAQVLNERGHRNTSGGAFSGHLVRRMLSNRAYLGELSFRDISVPDCHEPLIDTDTFATAERLLAERGEDRAHRKANSSDYTLTGLMRCPACNKAMIGTRAHGRNKVYRYYTCYKRARYDTKACNSFRLNADAVEDAVLQALARFYRTEHQLIADAVDDACRQFENGATDRQAEIATIRTKIATTNGKIDRYLSAFEDGSLDAEMVGPRLTELRATIKQLTSRYEELSATLEPKPTVPDQATLAEVADAIADIIESGTDQTRKALIETLVAEVKITGVNTIVPIFRIPQPPSHGKNASLHAKAPIRGKPQTGTARDAVRAMTNLVELIRGYSRKGYLRDRFASLLDQLHDCIPQSVEPVPYRHHAIARRLAQSTRDEIVAKYEVGIPSTQLMIDSNLGKGTVLKILREGGATVRNQGLTEEQVTEAARLYHAGRSLQSLGNHLGVDKTTVRSALLKQGVVMRDSHGHQR